MTIDTAEVAAIKARVSLLDFIGQHVALRKKGREHTGLCPFHKEKTPSFTVRPMPNLVCRSSGLKATGASWSCAGRRLFPRRRGHGSPPPQARS
jgi:hypothetical protein